MEMLIIDGDTQNDSAAPDNALLKKLDKQLGKAIKRTEKYRKQYEKNRDAVDLSGHGGKDNEINPYLIFSTLSALVPALYAKNPEIEIRPTRSAVESVGDGVTPWIGFAETAEHLLQREFVDNTHLKRRMKSCLLSTMTTGIGWLKMSLQDDLRTDTLQHNRLNDAQDNIQQIESLSQQFGEPSADKDTIREELELQTEHVEAALQGQRELFVQKGLVIDVVQSEDMFILDESISDMSDYAHAEALAQRIWMGADEYKRTFGVTELPTGTKKFNSKSDEQTMATDEDTSLLEVWEVWHKGMGKVFTFARGAQKYAREPYSPEPTGERWYPFFALIFNPVNGRFHPLSDVEPLIDYQSEYTHLRSQQRNLRTMNKPVYVVPKSGDLSANDADRLVQTVKNNSTEGTWVAIDLPATQPINQAIQQFPPPQVNQALYDPSTIYRDIEMMTRSGDASRGYINKAKTATEAGIMAAGTRDGMSERQDIIEDFMRDMAKMALEIMLQSYSESDVSRLLGNNAKWENAPLDIAFKYLSIDIRAGSTSKPNKFQEREQWMQLMPVIQQSVGQMAQMYMQGQAELANALKKLLEETMQRFDERIDLDEFIPDFEAMKAEQQQQQMMQMVQQAMGQQPAPAQPQQPQQPQPNGV